MSNDNKWIDDTTIKIYESVLFLESIDSRLKEIKQGLIEAIERGRLAGLEEAAAKHQDILYAIERQIREHTRAKGGSDEQR